MAAERVRRVRVRDSFKVDPANPSQALVLLQAERHEDRDRIKLTTQDGQVTLRPIELARLLSDLEELIADLPVEPPS